MDNWGLSFSLYEIIACFPESKGGRRWVNLILGQHVGQIWDLIRVHTWNLEIFGLTQSRKVNK